MIIERSISNQPRITIAVDHIHVRWLTQEELDYKQWIATMAFDYLRGIGETKTMRTHGRKNEWHLMKLRSESGIRWYDINIIDWYIDSVKEFIIVINKDNSKYFFPVYIGKWLVVDWWFKFDDYTTYMIWYKKIWKDYYVVVDWKQTNLMIKINQFFPKKESICLAIKEYLSQWLNDVEVWWLARLDSGLFNWQRRKWSQTFLLKDRDEYSKYFL